MKPPAPLSLRDQELDQGLGSALNQKSLNSGFQLTFSEVGFLATLILWVAENKLVLKTSCGKLGEVYLPLVC